MTQKTNPGDAAAIPRTPASRAVRAAIVLLGIVVPQFILYGPSLTGSSVLLPLELLTQPGMYAPAEAGPLPARNATLSDQVLAIELRRQFATQEVRAGRLPLWNPHCYCGAPFMAANNTEVFSPYRVLDYIAPAPGTIAWNVMLRALIGGLGTYLFLRRALGVGFWAAALGAWCFPLTGFQVIWTGYPPSHAASWLPMLLFTADRAVRRPFGWSVAGLAATTALMLVSGHAATGAQVLVATGLYALFRLFATHGRAVATTGRASVLALGLGFGLGGMLSAPQSLPTAEYLATSHRVATRGEGEVETKAQGLAALPQVVMPYCWGHKYDNGVYLMDGNRLEHAATGYAGLLIALALAPLAWVASRRRRTATFFAALVGFSLIPTLGIPGLTLLFEIPPLNLLRNNRLVFATGTAILVLGALGLDAILRGELAKRRPWFAVPAVLLAGLAVWTFARSASLPTPLDGTFEAMLKNPERAARIPRALREPGALDDLASRYSAMFAVAGMWCVIGLAFWGALWQRVTLAPKLALGVAAIGLIELCGNAYGVKPQSDPDLYYPRIDALEFVADQPPGRTIGLGCLPANLLQTHGLHDVRGYDGADPAHLVRMVRAAHNPQSPTGNAGPSYARTQRFWPRKSGLTDLFGIRYLVYPGEPKGRVKPAFDGEHHFVLEMPNALPRPFVPARVERVADLDAQFERVAAESFDPREIAFVDGEVGARGPIRGTATITRELPSEIDIEYDMETPGVIVLQDLWYAGWNAYLDGTSIPVHRSNFAFRAVEVPAGKGRVEFRYEPASFRNGLIAFVLALAGIGAWTFLTRGREAPARTAESDPSV